jgi:hypothetical protein
VGNTRRQLQKQQQEHQQQQVLRLNWFGSLVQTAVCLTLCWRMCVWQVTAPKFV